MSVEYSAQVVCGFKIEEREVTALETIYNHLTGEHYEIETKVQKYFVGDIEIEDFCDEDCERFYGFDIIRSGDGYSCDLFLGKVIAATGEHFSLYDKFSTDIPAEVYLYEEKLGIEHSFFLVFNWS